MRARWLVVCVILIAATFGWQYRDELSRRLPSWLFGGSPHERYARELRRAHLDRTPAGFAWLSAADAVLGSPEIAAPVQTRSGRFDESEPVAVAWRFHVKRGQRIVIDVETGAQPVFVDLFDAGDDLPAGAHTHVASAADRSTVLTFEPDDDGDVVARVQPALGARGTYRIAHRAEATLGFPVKGMGARAVGGVFGDRRESGQRRHEGIDIFAPRGTAVLAVADGVVSPQTTNALGGNVVWVWSPARGVALYYAHLDRHAVTPGDRVSVGDVVGYIGTTGNAKGSSPHLHFGIYAARGGAVDPLPYVCDAPCGERLMQPPRPANGRDS